MLGSDWLALDLGPGRIPDYDVKAACHPGQFFICSLAGHRIRVPCSCQGPEGVPNNKRCAIGIKSGSVNQPRQWSCSLDVLR